MATYFLEKSYVIAVVIWIKRRRFNESFVTLEECNFIRDILQKEFNRKNIKVLITDEIDSGYFNIHDGIIVLNRENNVDLQIIEQRYQGYIPNIDILLTLWNEQLIIESLRDVRKQ